MCETNFNSEKGGSFLLVIAIIVGFGFMGSILAIYIIGENQVVAIHTDKQNALYAAESGLEYTLGMLSDSSSWRNTSSAVPVGGSKFSITVDDKSTIPALGDTLFATIVATSAQFVKIIEARLIVSWTNVAYAGNDIDFINGKGNITGNMHANDEAKIGSKYSVSGSVTEAPPKIDLPVIDWNFYMNEALTAGQYVDGDKVFEKSGSPYTGVWYITKKLSIKDNNVEVYGTIVAMEEIEINKNNVKIYATPSNYPAILCGDDLKIEMNNTVVEGLVYSDNNITMDKNNGVFRGAMIAKNTIKNEGNNLTIILDPSYLGSLSGMSISGEMSTPQMVSWQER